MPIPSILQKTRSSDSICNAFSIRKSLQMHYNLVSANSQNLSNNKIFEQKMSDSNCDSPSQGECVPITPHPLYNPLDGTRTHTGTILSRLSAADWTTRGFNSTRSDSNRRVISQIDYKSIAVNRWATSAFYTRCRQSSINHGHCF